MSVRSICLNCGAKKSLGYSICVSCGSKFEDQEKLYKTEQEKRKRVRELTSLKKRERKEYLRSEESKQAVFAWAKWDKKKFPRVINILALIFYDIPIIVFSIILVIILSFFFPVIAIVVLIIAIFIVAVHIVYKKNKIAKTNVFNAKQREEYLTKEELYKYCNNCGDLVLEKLRSCPKCGQEFGVDN